MWTGKPSAAATVVPHRPLLLLLLLLLWSLTGPLTPALAQDHCNDAADTILGEGEHHTFLKKADDEPTEMTLFVKRGNSFAGFTVNVNGSDGTEHTAWFPADEECFPDTDTWYQLLLFVEIKTENPAIEFGFETYPCQWTCERHNAPQDLQSMSVVAHGAARWTTYMPPSECHKPLSTQPKHHKLPTCNKPEPEPTPGPSTGAIIGATFAVLLVAIPAVVVGAVLLYRKKKGLPWLPKSYTTASQTPSAQDFNQDNDDKQQHNGV